MLKSAVGVHNIVHEYKQAKEVNMLPPIDGLARLCVLDPEKRK